MSDTPHSLKASRSWTLTIATFILSRSSSMFSRALRTSSSSFVSKSETLCTMKDLCSFQWVYFKNFIIHKVTFNKVRIGLQTNLSNVILIIINVFEEKWLWTMTKVFRQQKVNIKNKSSKQSTTISQNFKLTRRK